MAKSGPPGHEPLDQRSGTTVSAHALSPNLATVGDWFRFACYGGLDGAVGMASFRGGPKARKAHMSPLRGAAHGLAPLAGQAGVRPADEVFIKRLGLRCISESENFGIKISVELRS